MSYGNWDNSRDAYNQVYERDGGYMNPERRPHHEAKTSHELIAGAAAFAGFAEFEKKQREEGKTVEHAFAKELLAGFAAAEIDKLAETKGRDEWDTHEARKRAKEHSNHLYEEHYERGYGANEYNPDEYRPHEHMREHHEREEHRHRHQQQSGW